MKRLVRSGRKWFAAAVGVGWATLLGGCHTSTVRGMYADEFNCPDDEVKVESLAGDRYRATGCGEVVYQCINTTCIPTRVVADEPSAKYVRLADAPAQTSEPIATEARREKKDGQVLIALDLVLENRTLVKLRAAAQGKKSAIQIKLVKRDDEEELKKCELSMLINGQRVPPLKALYAKTKAFGSLRSDLSPEVVVELGSASRLALRACDERWSLRPEQVAEVRRFIELYEEETAWSGPASDRGTGGLLAPRGGWPAWRADAARPPAVTAGAALPAQELFTLLSPSVFRVEAMLATGVVQGSAVAVSKSELLTNCHVLEGARKITVKQGKKEYVATVVRSDPRTDRCALIVADADFVPVRGVRAYSELQVGEALYTLGAPSGLDLSLSNGILSGLREEDGVQRVQTTAPVSPGSSGGGLFDARGNLVGITTSVLVGRERLNQSLNFAIPAESFYQL
jgi:S1-C subfamily serine protease